MCPVYICGNFAPLAMRCSTQALWPLRDAQMSAVLPTYTPTMHAGFERQLVRVRYTADVARMTAGEGKAGA